VTSCDVCSFVCSADTNESLVCRVTCARLCVVCRVTCVPLCVVCRVTCARLCVVETQTSVWSVVSCRRHTQTSDTQTSDTQTSHTRVFGLSCHVCSFVSSGGLF